jgi:N-acetylneuraminic acid mutarotase
MELAPVRRLPLYAHHDSSRPESVTASALPPKKIGSGWQSYPAVVGVGDLDGDRRNDLVARRSDGTLWLYAGNGSGGFRYRKQIGTSKAWNGYTQLAGMGDFTGDRRNDLLALAPNGYLYVYKGTGKGSFSSSRVLVSKGFSSFV